MFEIALQALGVEPSEALMVGDRTMDTARHFRMSPARVSQVRRELCQDWAQFHGEAVVAA